FGLVYIDYKTFERIPKDSFLWYKKVIEENTFEV
ncbi:MAG TPA: family 1 glycosylhydrolase, partial [Petrotogaceae bacterium]|nr:family 1 glycosylhydrolase [Petrotogaceae bacterium]